MNIHTQVISTDGDNQSITRYFRQTIPKTNRALFCLFLRGIFKYQTKKPRKCNITNSKRTVFLFYRNMTSSATDTELLLTNAYRSFPHIMPCTLQQLWSMQSSQKFSCATSNKRVVRNKPSFANSNCSLYKCFYKWSTHVLSSKSYNATTIFQFSIHQRMLSIQALSAVHIECIEHRMRCCNCMECHISNGNVICLFAVRQRYAFRFRCIFQYSHGLKSRAQYKNCQHIKICVSVSGSVSTAIILVSLLQTKRTVVKTATVKLQSTSVIKNS